MALHACGNEHKSKSDGVVQRRRQLERNGKHASAEFVLRSLRAIVKRRDVTFYCRCSHSRPSSSRTTKARFAFLNSFWWLLDAWHRAPYVVNDKAERVQTAGKFMHGVVTRWLIWYLEQDNAWPKKLSELQEDCGFISPFILRRRVHFRVMGEVLLFTTEDALLSSSRNQIKQKKTIEDFKGVT